MADRGRRRCRPTCGRPLTLIAESDLNDPRMVTPREAGGLGPRRAVERRLPPRRARGADRGDERLLRRLRAAGGAGEGVRARLLPRRHVRLASAAARHGVPVDTATMPTWRLVVCQPEPRPDRQPRPRRPPRRPPLDDDQLVCAALLTLAGPFTPMLFQGEEWAASTPFQFFTSHPEPELGRGGRATGRRAEFARRLGRAGGPRPAGPGHLRALQARLVGGRHRPARRRAGRPTGGSAGCAARSPT